jgi:hypothetical protein
MQTVRRGGFLSRRLHRARHSLRGILFAAVPVYPVWERELRQEDTFAGMSAVGEIEMAVRLCNAEYDTVMSLIASPFIQRQEIMCGPCPLVSPSVFINHVQVLPAPGTMAVLPDKSCILRAVVELHLSALELTFESPHNQHSYHRSSAFWSGGAGIPGRHWQAREAPGDRGVVKGPHSRLPNRLPLGTHWPLPAQIQTCSL